MSSCNCAYGTAPEDIGLTVGICFYHLCFFVFCFFVFVVVELTLCWRLRKSVRTLARGAICLTFSNRFA